MKNSYQVRAQAFIRKFYPYIEESLGATEVIPYIEAVRKFNQEKHRRVRVNNGMTRVVFISNDYVIKYNRYAESHYAGGCEEELLAYQNACKDGYQHLFAEVTRYDYRGHSFYIMPLIKGIDEYREDDLWMEFFSDAEIDYIEENFYDIHSGNFGIHNDKCIIFDYAWNAY